MVTETATFIQQRLPESSVEVSKQAEQTLASKERVEPTIDLDQVPDIEMGKHSIQLEEEEKAKKEKEYQALIASADKLVNEKKYLQSIAEYTDALKIKKAEKYPANQIKKVEGLIKAEEELAKKAEKEKAEKEKLEAKYNSLIADANKLFEKESYQESIEIYLKALEIKKAEKIPTEQIAKAKEFIKIAKDKAKAEAEKIAAANKLETEYKELREKGDKSYKSNNYSASTSFYEQALVKKPGDSYSISQIEKIKDILTAEKEKADKLAADLLAEKKRKEQEAADKKAAADKLEKAYQALIAKADKSRDSKKYTESIGIYEEALVIKPKDSYSLTQKAVTNSSVDSKEFNKDGLITKSTSEYLSFSGKYATQYNSTNGKVNSSVFESFDIETGKAKSSSKTTYEYKNGLLESVHNDPTSSYPYRTTYTYNSNKELIKENKTGKNDKITSKKVFSEYNGDNYKSEVTFYDSKTGEVSSSYAKEYENNEVKRSLYTNSKGVKVLTTNRRNEHGDIFKILKDGELDKEYKYEYDKYGNWTKKVSISKSSYCLINFLLIATIVIRHFLQYILHYLHLIQHLLNLLVPDENQSK